jgi:sugar phosphate isomerase/epimerase
MTTRPWSLKQAIDGFRKAGIPGITVWRQHLQPAGAREAGRMLRDSGLTVVSLCRGGFFPAATESGRRQARDDNRLAIEEAAAIGAPVVVLVCGAVPGLALAEARNQIRDGIAYILPEAEAAGVKLAVEPMHPMYADSRSAINTLKQANDLVAELHCTNLGVVVDVYHVWWDPNLAQEIRRAGNSILSFHVSDWRTPTRDLLNDRGLMGEGCINIRQIREWVESAGFNGYIEVEIFSDEYWAGDPAGLLEQIKRAYLNHC